MAIGTGKAGAFTIGNTALLGILGLVTAFPFYYVFIISFADYQSFVKTPVYILPTSFTTEAYRFIFSAHHILSSFLVSTFITVAGTLLSMALTIGLAYPFSRQRLPGRRYFFLFMVFTMFFNGGLIPYYMTVKTVGLVDSILVLMVPMAVNAINVILLRNYFEAVPPSLEESAKMDGASDLRVLWQIVLPTTAPIIATLSLFYAVERWNEWYHAMLFISSKRLYPLQMVLREVLFNFDQSMGSMMGKSILKSRKLVYGRSVQMAIVAVATVPILVVYPALQKHFTRGIMLGSIKE